MVSSRRSANDATRSRTWEFQSNAELHRPIIKFLDIGHILLKCALFLEYAFRDYGSRLGAKLARKFAVSAHRRQFSQLDPRCDPFASSGSSGRMNRRFLRGSRLASLGVPRPPIAKSNRWRRYLPCAWRAARASPTP